MFADNDDRRLTVLLHVVRLVEINGKRVFAQVVIFIDAPCSKPAGVIAHSLANRSDCG
jgi:hypothetical protein